MRLRNITGSEEKIEKHEFVINEYVEKKGNWGQVFGNEQPIRIEVGMGKGKFISQMAKENPNINFIGIEKYSSVLVRALDKRPEQLENLYYLCIDARELPDVFAEGEIDKIYLNFSDPWPKDRHAKRRLTSRQFLEKYISILKENGKIEFKTDNRNLFEFSLEEVVAANWILEAHTFDLHNDNKLVAGNIMTEYEEKFSSRGNPICKLIMKKPL
jgi:tRNA (guanine-N(7)-)-methyltransferase